MRIPLGVRHAGSPCLARSLTPIGGASKCGWSEYFDGICSRRPLTGASLLHRILITLPLVRSSVRYVVTRCCGRMLDDLGWINGCCQDWRKDMPDHAGKGFILRNAPPLTVGPVCLVAVLMFLACP